ncbi:MAG: response regulator [Chloroflexi bacterium]|nr:MAG: hypothetical protein AUH67_02145 [Chloroflexi bacterium 13_1_40CM_4_69_19]OLD51386.1 MAG: hypothetical protein AUI58_07860 [Chloroflexi bacterium 13_1_40CM_2_70_6]TME97077.1 MAG: response regulator [Chloroflexota bacterium]TMF63463.1 MAG: response regulator [Chloroflexota bacterium]TMG35484.1 MAG: response regulator [Chloroflexota bacterium]
MNILVVDDNAMNVELFRDVLESDGHEVSVARDGVTGLDRALRGRFDLMILDIQMPGLDGHAVCRTLRERGVRGRIVALSSSAMPDQVTRGMDAGFDAYLTKPISPAALKEAVRVHGGTRGV